MRIKLTWFLKANLICYVFHGTSLLFLYLVGTWKSSLTDGNSSPFLNVFLIGDKNEDKEKEIKQEFGQTCDWIKKRLGDKVASVQISNRLSTSPCVLVSGKFGWSANMERWNGNFCSLADTVFFSSRFSFWHPHLKLGFVFAGWWRHRLLVIPLALSLWEAGGSLRSILITQS